VIGRGSRPVPAGAEVSPAWLLAEGDQLEGGPVVLSVQRDVVAGTVRLSTSAQPDGVTLDRADPVSLTRRAL
jgi:hypothetical protein